MKNLREKNQPTFKIQETRGIGGTCLRNARTLTELAVYHQKQAIALLLLSPEVALSLELGSGSQHTWKNRKVHQQREKEV